MINLTMIGNLGTDARINETNGRKAISFAVAHNVEFKDAKGQEIKRTTWVNCTIWKEQGQSAKIKEYLLSGTKVWIEGEPSVRTYKNKEGITVAAMDVNVRRVELLSAKQQEQAPEPAQASDNPPY
jgi:single-strand DNA-binding protein